MESARNRLAELELEYGIEKAKLDSIRSKLFGALRGFYQERGNEEMVRKWGQCANLDRMRERISKKQVQRPLAEKRGLDTWEKVVNFTTNEWLPSRLSFGKFKGRREVKSENLNAE